jgi:hypothetical protein
MTTESCYGNSVSLSTKGIIPNQEGNIALPYVAIDSLKPGMKLAKPLAKGNMVILGEGTELSDTWISRIADLGFDGVFIDGPAVQSIAKEKALAGLDARFRNILDKPYMRGIKEIVKEHIEGLYAG